MPKRMQEEVLALIVDDPADSPAGGLLDHLIRAVRADCVVLKDHLELHG